MFKIKLIIVFIFILLKFESYSQCNEHNWKCRKCNSTTTSTGRPQSGNCPYGGSNDWDDQGLTGPCQAYYAQQQAQQQAQQEAYERAVYNRIKSKFPNCEIDGNTVTTKQGDEIYVDDYGNIKGRKSRAQLLAERQQEEREERERERQREIEEAKEKELARQEKLRQEREKRERILLEKRREGNAKWETVMENPSSAGFEDFIKFCNENSEANIAYISQIEAKKYYKEMLDYENVMLNPTVENIKTYKDKYGEGKVGKSIVLEEFRLYKNGLKPPYNEQNINEYLEFSTKSNVFRNKFEEELEKKLYVNCSQFNIPACNLFLKYCQTSIHAVEVKKMIVASEILKINPSTIKGKKERIEILEKSNLGYENEIETLNTAIKLQKAMKKQHLLVNLIIPSLGNYTFKKSFGYKSYWALSCATEVGLLASGGYFLYKYNEIYNDYKIDPNKAHWNNQIKEAKNNLYWGIGLASTGALFYVIDNLILNSNLSLAKKEYKNIMNEEILSISFKPSFNLNSASLSLNIKF